MTVGATLSLQCGAPGRCALRLFPALQVRDAFDRFSLNELGNPLGLQQAAHPSLHFVHGDVEHPGAALVATAAVFGALAAVRVCSPSAIVLAHRHSTALTNGAIHISLIVGPLGDGVGPLGPTQMAHWTYGSNWTNGTVRPWSYPGPAFQPVT